MQLRVIVAIVICLSAAPLFAADLGTPRLSESLAASRFFDPDRLLLSGATRYSISRDQALSSQFGLSYAARESEVSAGLGESLYKVQARAGGKLEVTRNLYLTAAAKLPVFTYGLTSTQTGILSSQGPVSRHQYDFIRPWQNALMWSGEVGIHLGLGADLAVYYDQNTFEGLRSGQSMPEERFGTRLIFRFK